MRMTIEYLEEYIKLKHEADDLKARLDALGFPSGIRYSPLPRSETNEIPTLDDIIIQREKIRKKWQKKLYEAQGLLISIEVWMDSVEDPEVKQIVRLKYVDGLTWEEVSKEMFVSKTTVQRWLHNYLEQQ